jgi:hypothetical protein
MSVMTSSAVSTWWSGRARRPRVFSRDVAAFSSAPIASNISAISCASKPREPLNSRCSMKCETPARSRRLVARAGADPEADADRADVVERSRDHAARRSRARSAPTSARRDRTRGPLVAASPRLADNPAYGSNDPLDWPPPAAPRATAGSTTACCRTLRRPLSRSSSGVRARVVAIGLLELARPRRRSGVARYVEESGLEGDADVACIETNEQQDAEPSTRARSRSRRIDRRSGPCSRAAT